MIHLVRAPRRPVGDFVEQFWLVRGAILTPRRQMLLPDGALVVMFNLGPPQRLCERADTRRHESFRASWVSGQQPQPIVIEQSGAYHLAAIRFRPGGAFPLFRFSVAELTGRVVELEDIWGLDAKDVREQLGTATTDEERLATLERWVAWRLRREDTPDRRIAFAAQCLQRGDIAVRQIAEAMGWSSKHLAYTFEQWVGITPKLYGRVQRLQRTLALVGAQPEVDWAKIAGGAGFYDQAHLINEFHELVGLTPGEFLQRRSPYRGYLNVA